MRFRLHIIPSIVILLLAVTSFTKVGQVNAEHVYSVIDIINFTNPSPSGVTINSVNDRAYVTLFYSSSISVINSKTDKITDTIAIPNSTHPDDIDFNIINGVGYLYVIDRSSSPDTLKVVNTSTKQVVATISVGTNGNDVAVNHANAKVYVTSDDGTTGPPDKVYVIDGTSNTVITTVSVGSAPLGVAVNSVNGRVYVANFESNTVSVIDGTSNGVIATVPVGLFPSAVAVDMSSNRIYVTNLVADTVSVIDGTSNRVITTIPVGDAPRAIAVNQYNHNVFVINSVENTVSVIDGTSNRVIDAIPVGNDPWKVAVNAAKDKVYVTNRNSNTVSVISKESPAACPTRNVQHWDKISFKILSDDLAQKLNLTANTELDIKVQDDPNQVADIKQKVLDFLKVPQAPRYAIQIIDVNYAIVCAPSAVSENIMSAKPTANITKVPSMANATGLR